MAEEGRIEHSVSTWRQPMPPPGGPARRHVISHVVERVSRLGRRRVRVAIDGMTAAGKTSFGHELADALAAGGRGVLRASLDDFKRPWSESHLYDRLSGEGYYRNAFDIGAIRRLLLEPASPTGTGVVALCSIDPLTQVGHEHTVVDMPVDGVLIVDGVFALRPELNTSWDLRIWLEVSPALSVRRGTARDTALDEDREKAESLHRDRYLPAELIYMQEVQPNARADILIDNSDFEHPQVLRG
jgi:uridine kinase